MASRQPIHAEVYVRRGEDIGRALRRFKKAVKNSGIMEELKERRFYEKPSSKRNKIKRQRKRLIAKERQARLDEEKNITRAKPQKRGR